MLFRTTSPVFSPHQPNLPPHFALDSHQFLLCTRFFCHISKPSVSYFLIAVSLTLQGLFFPLNFPKPFSGYFGGNSNRNYGGGPLKNQRGSDMGSFQLLEA